MNAASKGHEEIVKLLRAANANVNEKATYVSRLCKSFAL
jgi:hypothetical protein